MARYDKYDGVTGGFRAAAKTDQIEAEYDVPLGTGLDAAGLAELKVPGNTGFVGVCIVDRTKRKAGKILDIMTAGEIVDVAGLAAGTDYYLDADGDLTASAPAAGAAGYYVGHTVEAWRLVVRFQRMSTPV